MVGSLGGSDCKYRLFWWCSCPVLILSGATECSSRVSGTGEYCWGLCVRIALNGDLIAALYS
jgi:hypothetical protein